jgi:tetratricopeptide (TPR) repeat protein
VLLVQLYLQRGNLSQAIEKVQDLKRQNPLDLGVSFELAYLYYQNNQIDQAQQEFQVATILNPTYANARYFLGLIYDQKGMTAQALDQFQKIQALSPGNAQVAAIIANIQAGRSALANNISAPALSGQDTASPVIAPDAHAKTQKVSK